MTKGTFYMVAGVVLFALGCALNAIVFLKGMTIDKWIVIALGLPFVGAALLVRPDFLDRIITKIPFVKTDDKA